MNRKSILKIFFTIIITIFLCWITSTCFGPQSDYTFFVTIILEIILAVLIPLEIIKTSSLNKKLLAVSICFIIISSNHLYLYSNLINLYKSKNIFAMVSIAILILDVLLSYLIKYSKSESSTNKAQNISKVQDNKLVSNNIDQKISNYKPLIVSIIVIFFIGIAIFSIYAYDKNKNFTIFNSSDIIINFTKASVSIITILAWIITVLAFIIESAKYIYSKLKKTHDERNIKELSFLSSIVLLSSLFIFIQSPKINLKTIFDKINLDEMFNITSKSDFIVIPLLLLIAIALILITFLIIKIMFDIIFSIDYVLVFKNIKSKFEKIIKQAFSIAHKIYNIVLDLIEKPLDFIQFIPDFFGEIKELIYNKDDANEVKILKKASFCFAIISFVTTSYGYEKCVFDNYWEALVISFAIQATLFVLGLKLPAILHKSSKLTKNKNESSKRSKRFFKFAVVVTYIFVLLSSSLFSFFYIANFSYTGTRYLDSNIQLKNEYISIIMETEDYINNQNDLLMKDITSKTNGLKTIEEIHSSNSNSNDDKTALESLEEQLKKELDEANENYAKKEAVYIEYAKNNQNQNEEYIEKQLAAEYAKQYRDQCEEKHNNILERISKIDAENIINNQSFDSQKQKLLIEILNDEPDIQEINKIMDNMSSILAQYIQDQGNKTDENCMENVSVLKELRQKAYYYTALKSLISNSDPNSVSLESLRNDISSPINVPLRDNKEYENDIINWRKAWTNRITNLTDIISLIPQLNLSKDKFDTIQKIKKLNDLSRRNLTDINLIERAFILLGSEYNMLAISSIVIALFMDLAALFSSISIFYIENNNIFNKEKRENNEEENIDKNE